MLCAIYCRVSTRGQEEKGFSLQDQEDRGRAFAEKNNLPYKIYKDVESGSSDSRKEYGEIIQGIEGGKITHLWVLRFDRLARDIMISESLKKLVRKHGVIFYEDGQHLEFNDEGVDLVSAVKGKIAETERERIRKRLNTGLRACYGKGLKHFGNLYGWTHDGYGDDGRRKYKVVPVEKEMVQLIYKFALDGLGLSAIARKLSSLGYKQKNGSPWSHSSIRQILTSSIYAGVYKNSKGELIESKIYEPFVSKETHLKMQELYPKFITTQRRGRPFSHPGSGLIVCAHCGSRYHYWAGWGLQPSRSGVKKKFLKWTYLHTARCNCPNKKNYKAEVIHIVISWAFSYIIENSTEVEKMLLAKSDSREEYEALDRFEEQKKVLNNEIESLKKAIVAGVSLDILVPDINSRVDQISKIDKEISKLNQQIDLKTASNRVALNHLKTIKTFDLHLLTGRSQNEYIKQFITKIVVDNSDILVHFLDGSTRYYNYDSIRKIQTQAIKKRLQSIKGHPEEEMLRKVIQGEPTFGREIEGMPDFLDPSEWSLEKHKELEEKLSWRKGSKRAISSDEEQALKTEREERARLMEQASTKPEKNN